MGVEVEVAVGDGVGVFVVAGVGVIVGVNAWAMLLLVGKVVGIRGALRWQPASTPMPKSNISPEVSIVLCIGGYYACERLRCQHSGA